MNCPDCGDELSDFTACGCALAPARPRGGGRGAGSMRTMVAKKLARLAEEKARRTAAGVATQGAALDGPLRAGKP